MTVFQQNRGNSFHVSTNENTITQMYLKAYLNIHGIIQYNE